MANNERTIADVIVAGLKAGQPDAVILATVYQEFPDARTTKNSVDWYRSQLRQRGILAPAAPRRKYESEREAKAARKAGNRAWRERRKERNALEKRMRQRGWTESRIERFFARSER